MDRAIKINILYCLAATIMTLVIVWPYVDMEFTF